MAKVADALHYVHKQGLVHLDIKPSNILIDNQGEVYLVDFGAALREEEIDKASGYCGTTAYVSPEQAFGNGHRVDRRSDIFSLGVVLYELLAGRRPFNAQDTPSLLKKLSQEDPAPIRQYNETIPKELEWICFKALSKRAGERYQAAFDFAEDLRRFLKDAPQNEFLVPVSFSNGQPAKEVLSTIETRIATPASESTPLRIVPKGLRSFGDRRIDFFLE